MLAYNFVRNRRAGPRELDHRPFRGLHRFAHSLRDLVRLARGDTDFSFAIPHRNQRIEGEPASTLHHLGDAVDGYDVLDVIAGAITVSAVSPRSTSATPIATSTAATAATGPVPTRRSLGARGTISLRCWSFARSTAISLR
jgi:hypothetical protein